MDLFFFHGTINSTELCLSHKILPRRSHLLLLPVKFFFFVPEKSLTRLDDGIIRVQDARAYVFFCCSNPEICLVGFFFLEKYSNLEYRDSLPALLLTSSVSIFFQLPILDIYIYIYVFIPFLRDV